MRHTHLIRLCELRDDLDDPGMLHGHRTIQFLNGTMTPVKWADTKHAYVLHSQMVPAQHTDGEGEDLMLALVAIHLKRMNPYRPAVMCEDGPLALVTVLVQPSTWDLIAMPVCDNGPV